MEKWTMRTRLTSLIKKFLLKVSRRNYIILNPSWYVASRTNGFDILGDGLYRDKRYLPVRYNYHTPKNWKLHYDLRGNTFGSLHYTLSVPNNEPFCDVRFDVQLPFTWSVELDMQVLIGNGARINPVLGKTIPIDSPWLIGQFEFCSERNPIMHRRTGHRVKLESSQADEIYFNQWIYDDYDNNAAHFPQEILETVKKYHPLSGKLLDVGCATGLLVDYALALGLDAEGVDFSKWAIDKANIRTQGRCRLLDLDKADLNDFSSLYDIITLHSVIEHLSDPERILNLLHSLCRPGGIIYLQTLNADSLMHRLMREDWGGYTDYTHKSAWITADWLGKTAKQVGFEVLMLKRYYVWNDNAYDDVWRMFASFIQVYPASVLLEDEFGDGVEVILHRPSD